MAAARTRSGAARVQRWLSVAAGPLAYGPARARVLVLFRRPVDPTECIAAAHALFKLMEQTLAQRVPRSRQPDDRRRRALQLHATCSGGQRPARRLSVAARLAGTDRGVTGLRADGAQQDRAGSGVNVDEPPFHAGERAVQRLAGVPIVSRVASGDRTKPGAAPVSSVAFRAGRYLAQQRSTICADDGPPAPDRSARPA
jgi:hypothetical protein